MSFSTNKNNVSSKLGIYKGEEYSLRFMLQNKDKEERMQVLMQMKKAIRDRKILNKE